MTHPATQINKLVELPPIHIGEKVIHPVAELKGWYTARGTQTYSGGGAALRLTPKAVTVEEGDKIIRIEIIDPLFNLLRKIVLSGLVVSGICLLSMLVGSLVMKRKTKSDAQGERKWKSTS